MSLDLGRHSIWDEQPGESSEQPCHEASPAKPIELTDGSVWKPPTPSVTMRAVPRGELLVLPWSPKR